MKKIDLLKIREKNELMELGSLIEGGVEVNRTKENAKRIWRRSEDQAEREKARRFLIILKRRDWLEDIHEEIVQWDNFRRQLKRLRKEKESEEKESFEANEERVVEVNIRHRMCYWILGYSNRKIGEEFSQMWKIRGKDKLSEL